MSESHGATGTIDSTNAPKLRRRGKRAGRSRRPPSSQPTTVPTSNLPDVAPEPAALSTPAPYRRATPPTSAPVVPTIGEMQVNQVPPVPDGGSLARRLPTRAEALRILVDRANGGSVSALGCLRELLDQCPEIWQHVGDLGRHSEKSWIDLISGGEHLTTESVRRHVSALKAQLTGEAPTPLERLVIDQVACTWLSLHHAEMQAAQPGSCSPALATLRYRRAESAQRRHLAALRTLATLRDLLPPTPAPRNAPEPPAAQHGLTP